MSFLRDEGEKLGKGNRALPQRQMISFFEGVVVEVNPNQAWGEPAKMLGMIDQAKSFFCGGVSEIVPVAECRCGQTT